MSARKKAAVAEKGTNENAADESCGPAMLRVLAWMPQSKKRENLEVTAGWFECKMLAATTPVTVLFAG